VILRPPTSRRRLTIALVLVAVVAAALAALGPPATAAPTELLISEYLEGSGSNKALEIFNGTGAPVVLDGTYDVRLFANGSATATATLPLTGTIAPGDVFVLVRSAADPALLALADQMTTNFLWNGNDAVALAKSGVLLDVIGQIGVDPGTEWGTGDTSTADNTLRRKPSVEAGDADGANAFDPAVQWTGHPIDAFDGIGSHSITGGGGGGGGGGGTNTAPDAVVDAVTADEDEAATIPVLTNDTDVDGDVLVVTGVSDPVHGSATVAGSSVTYVPDVDFSGTDTFDYTVGDGRGGVDSATVSVTVTPVNDDPDPDDDAVTLAEEGVVTVNVLANDEDADDDTLVVVSVDDPDHGAASIAPDAKSVVYAPDPDWNGVEAFAYTVSDGQQGSETGEITVTVTAVDDPPRAEPDTVVVTQGVATILDPAANDTPGPADEAGQALVVTSVGASAHGTSEVIATGPNAGKVRYTPAAGYVGPDSFTYVVSDGAATASSTVSVTVRAAGSGQRSPCGLTPTIVGTNGADTIVGTPGNDVIFARRGNDVVEGNGGDDVICGGPGADRITTLAGADRVAGGAGADTIETGDGNDRVRGGFGGDTITTGAGDDRVTAGPGGDSVDAGAGSNTVGGGTGDDTLIAGSGADRVDGGPGTDTCDADGGRNSVIRCE
jgi:Ca2+-binding RTX toxin-like protein